MEVRRHSTQGKGKANRAGIFTRIRLFKIILIFSVERSILNSFRTTGIIKKEKKKKSPERPRIEEHFLHKVNILSLFSWDKCPKEVKASESLCLFCICLI